MMSEGPDRLADMVTPTKPRVRPGPVPPRGEHIELALKCNSCGRVSTYEIGHVLVHPELERCRAEGWDGVVLGRVIVCRRCGAEDDYRLTAAAHVTLTAQVLTLWPVVPLEEGRGIEPTPAVRGRFPGSRLTSCARPA